MKQSSAVRTQAPLNEDDLLELDSIVRQYAQAQESSRMINLDSSWFQFLTFMQNAEFYLLCKNGKESMRRACEVMKQYYSVKHHLHTDRVNTINYYVGIHGLKK